MNIFADYPIGSHENPFEIDGKGNYFAYLTNRDCCLSYLSDNLSDFNYMNNDLYHAMPMGYTSLWVLERCYVANSDGFSKIYKKEKNIHLLFRIDELDAEYKITHQSELLASISPKTRNLLLSKCGSIDEEIEGLCKFLKNAKEELQCVKISLVGSRLLEDYNWH